MANFFDSPIFKKFTNGEPVVSTYNEVAFTRQTLVDTGATLVLVVVLCLLSYKLILRK
jgi:hypothetical protein